MFEFEDHKQKLEKEYGQNLKEVLSEYYLKRNMGPSLTALELGVPRQIVQYYINQFNLIEQKRQLIREKEMDFR